MQTLLHWFINALAIMLAAYVIPGAQATLLGALLAAVVIGILNLFIKPILIILTLPINILTLGLFTLVINGLLIMLAGSIVPGFTIAGFGTAVIFSLVLMLIHLVFLRKSNA
jgi:putative membrane protein